MVKKQLTKTTEEEVQSENEDDGSVSSILVKLQNRFGSELVNFLSYRRVEALVGFSWGIPSINYICGDNPFVGIPAGRIIELFGNESSGKTTLSIHAVACTQAQGIVCGFIDAEHAISMKYMKALGVNVDELIFSQPDNGEEAFDILHDMIRAGVKLIVVDSVAALTPLKELEGSMEKKSMGLQARMMGQGLRKLTAICGKRGASVIFINQIRMKIGEMFGNPETTPGGKALKFWATIRLRVALSIAKNKAIKGSTDTLTGKKDEERMGSMSTVQCVKNKVAPPFRDTECAVHYGQGFDADMDLFDFAVSNELLTKGRGRFKLDGKTFAKFSELVDRKKEVIEMLRKVYA